MKLSEADLALLRILQEDCRQPIKHIAKRLGMPITTVYDKIKRMRRDGVITGYIATLDHDKLGLPTTAIILVAVEYLSGVEFSQEAIAERIAAFPEVTEVYIIAGDWDLLLKVKTKSIEDVGTFVIGKLRNVEGVRRTKTIAVFKCMKEVRTLPI